jgi:hypothetical protein
MEGEGYPSLSSPNCSVSSRVAAVTSSSIRSSTLERHPQHRTKNVSSSAAASYL